MIWNSVTLMTAMDLIIVGMVLAMLVISRRRGLFSRDSTAVVFFVAGMVLVGLFYLSDLLIMHVGPLIWGEAAAMRVMEDLHLNAAWVVTLIFVALLFAALLKFFREREYAERQMSLVTETLPIAIAYLDANERYRFVNRRYAEWYRISPEEIVGKRAAEVMDPERYALLAPHIRNALEGATVGFEGAVTLPHSLIPRDIQSRLVPDRDEQGIRGFFVLITDVTEQNELERQIVAASERERNAIGQDLHDNLGQTLTGASLKLQALAQQLERNGNGSLEMVEDLKKTVQQSIQDTRHLSRLLAPAFDGSRLDSALRSLANEATRLLDVECSAECQASESDTNIETVTHLYRIAQESVTNAARHGRAKSIRIVGRADGSRFQMEIIDDGVGIDADSQESRGIGINTMRYRARMIGGDLRIEPADGKGTRVVCNFPITSLYTSAPV